MYPVDFSETAQRATRYPAARLSPGLSPFVSVFMELGIEPRPLYIVSYRFKAFSIQLIYAS
jgi:hypothetical protein